MYIKDSSRHDKIYNYSYKKKTVAHLDGSISYQMHPSTGQCITIILFKQSWERCLPVPLHCSDTENISLTLNTNVTINLFLPLTLTFKPKPVSKPNHDFKPNPKLLILV